MAPVPVAAARSRATSGDRVQPSPAGAEHRADADATPSPAPLDKTPDPVCIPLLWLLYVVPVAGFDVRFFSRRLPALSVSRTWPSLVPRLGPSPRRRGASAAAPRTAPVLRSRGAAPTSCWTSLLRWPSSPAPSSRWSRACVTCARSLLVELGPALIAALDVRFVETDKPSSGFELAPVSIPTTKLGDYLLLVRLPTSRRKSFSWVFAHVHVTVASSWVIVRDPYMGGCATGVFQGLHGFPAVAAAAVRLWQRPAGARDGAAHALPLTVDDGSLLLCSYGLLLPLAALRWAGAIHRAGSAAHALPALSRCPVRARPRRGTALVGTLSFGFANNSFVNFVQNLYFRNFLCNIDVSPANHRFSFDIVLRYL